MASALHPNNTDGCETSSKTQKIPWEEKLEEARKYKASGNEFYNLKIYNKAVSKYHRALLYIKGIENSLEQHPLVGQQLGAADKLTSEAEAELKKMKMACYNNLAACLLLTPEPPYRKIVQHCDNVLAEAPTNTKAMYRKGVSLYNLNKIEEAHDILVKAHGLPGGQKDPAIRKHLRLCEESISAMDQKMKRTYQAMFEQPTVDNGASDRSTQSTICNVNDDKSSNTNEVCA